MTTIDYIPNPGELEACQIADMALSHVNGQTICGPVRALVEAARVVLPNKHCGQRPLDAESFASRVQVAQDLIAEAEHLASGVREAVTLGLAATSLCEM